MPCYASTWQLTRQPISSFAFAMHSMAHPRRSRGERILAAGGHKDGRFVTRIRIVRPDAPQTQGRPSRGGADATGVTTSLVRDPCELAIFADYLANGQRDQRDTGTGVVPVPWFISVAVSFLADCQQPSDKRCTDLTLFTGR